MLRLTAAPMILMYCLATPVLSAEQSATFLRFQHRNTTSYGLLDGDQVIELDGNIFETWSRTDTVHKLSDVRILTPTTPTQVFAMAGNYRSHLSEGTIPEKFQIPQPFLKPTSCLTAHNSPIIIPADATTVH
jgi:2-keto-4-pentenoate hydratase/2-oxohepta-3-ene-1,7-dioic acid hydratase in catechol pathway